MKSLNNLISSLQQNISQRNPTALVYSSKMNQKILKILQINGFIDGFFFFNNQKILVILNIHQKVMQYNVFLDLKILQNINLMVAVGINLLGHHNLLFLQHAKVY